VFDARAEDDVTGIQLWAASLVMARWVVDLQPVLAGKRVCELGAGCGLPSLAVLAYTDAVKVEWAWSDVDGLVAHGSFV
jgi:predicted nicotinamide N-methyase